MSTVASSLVALVRATLAEACSDQVGLCVAAGVVIGRVFLSVMIPVSLLVLVWRARAEQV